jgi:hypothetical protein
MKTFMESFILPGLAMLFVQTVLVNSLEMSLVVRGYMGIWICAGAAYYCVLMEPK